MTMIFLAAAALLLWRSPACVAAAREAAETFAGSVLPALFPMMALAALWRGAGWGARKAKPEAGHLAQGTGPEAQGATRRVAAGENAQGGEAASRITARRVKESGGMADSSVTSRNAASGNATGGNAASYHATRGIVAGSADTSRNVANSGATGGKTASYHATKGSAADGSVICRKAAGGGAAGGVAGNHHPTKDHAVSNTATIRNAAGGDAAGGNAASYHAIKGSAAGGALTGREALKATKADGWLTGRTAANGRAASSSAASREATSKNAVKGWAIGDNAARNYSACGASAGCETMKGGAMRSVRAGRNATSDDRLNGRRKALDATKRKEVHAPRRAGRLWKRLIGLPACAASALLLGLLGGSPTGAKLCGELPLSPVERKRLLAYTGTLSPMFFTGALALWTQSAAVGLRLLACHWLAALLSGQLSRLWFRDRAANGAHAEGSPRPAGGTRAVTQERSAERRCAKCGKPVVPSAQAAKAANTMNPVLPRDNVRTSANIIAQTSPGARLRDALAQSANALLVVCGAMMLCAVAFALLSGAAELLRPGFANTRHSAALHAVLEIGAGARALAGPGLSPGWQIALCGLCGFGGLSLWLQNMSFSAGFIRTGELLALRLLQGGLATGCYALWGALAGEAAGVARSAGNSIADATQAAGERIGNMAQSIGDIGITQSAGIVDSAQSAAIPWAAELAASAPLWLPIACLFLLLLMVERPRG